MSFILDALKKAEAERQRQTGPTLLEVRVTSPRRRFPVWILVIAGLLGINMVLLLVFLLRRPPAGQSLPAPLAVAPPAVAASSAPATEPREAAAPPAAAATTATPARVAPLAVTPPAAGTAEVPAAAQPPTGPPPVLNGTRAGAGPALSDDANMVNPADYAPAVSAGRASAAAAPRPRPPNIEDVSAQLPPLRLDMNVYSSVPADRYALINMHRVREGDTLPEGPRVMAIDRDGVELSYQGTEFMLRPQ